MDRRAKDAEECGWVKDGDDECVGWDVGKSAAACHEGCVGGDVWEPWWWWGGWVACDVDYWVWCEAVVFVVG